MALTLFSPAIIRSKNLVISSTTKVAFRLVPELETARGDELHVRAFGKILGAIFCLGLLLLLVINTFLTSDAFILQRLKQEVNVINDQKDATLREVASLASPAQVARAAEKLGMIPATTPQFIDLTQSPPGGQ